MSFFGVNFILQKFCSCKKWQISGMSWSSVEILKPKFGQYFAAGLVELMKLYFSRDYEARFGQDFEVSSLVKMLMFGWDFEVDACQDSENEIWSRFV